MTALGVAWGPFPHPASGGAIIERLLVTDLAFRSIEEALKASAAPLEVVTLSEAGDFQIAGKPFSGEPEPTIAWATHDLFNSEAARHFMVAVLKSPGLKWLQSSSAGVDHPVFQQVLGKGAVLTTSHGQAVPMADYVLWGVLDHLQRGPDRRAAQAEGRWERLEVREIDGLTFVIVGFGAVGQAVAQRAKAFGARVVAVRRDQTPHPLADHLIPPDRLADELPSADVVVLAAPLTDATRHMANKAFFARLKRGAILANVGRGGLVDEPALLDALGSGMVGHALLDVFEAEPLPADSPFWLEPKVTLTAHASGYGQTQDARNRDLFLQNLRRWFAGEPLLNQVAAV